MLLTKGYSHLFPEYKKHSLVTREGEERDEVTPLIDIRIISELRKLSLIVSILHISFVGKDECDLGYKLQSVLPLHRSSR